MIGLLDGICIYDEIGDTDEEVSNVWGATMSKDIGPFKAGEYVKYLQLANLKQPTGGLFLDHNFQESDVTVLVELDEDGKFIRGCQVELVSRRILNVVGGA